MNNLNILIPMAGSGKRFKDVGYTLPKPLIDINGKPMIQRLLENLPIKGHYIFIVQHEDNVKYGYKEILEELVNGNGCTIVESPGLMQGQACSALLSTSHIDNDTPLFIVNADNYFLWDVDHFLNEMKSLKEDGMIFTFEETSKSKNWCYAEVDKNNQVLRLVEKEPISTHALAGAFYWKKGSDFVKYANQMISKGITTNNEYYIGPVFNEALLDNKKVHNYQIEMKSMGTPSELEDFSKWLEVKKMSVKVDKLMTEKTITIENKLLQHKIKNILDEIKRGKPVIIVDEYDRENEGDIVIAAEKATPENLAFAARYARGLMCVPTTGEILDRLKIPQMVPVNTDKNGTPFTVSVDALEGATTGMSVYDRIQTLNVLLNDNSKPEELARPGHMFPLRAKSDLLKERRGHTEGSLELLKMAGLKQVSVIVEIMNDDGTMTKGGDLNKFANDHGLSIISIEEIYEAAYNESL
jgi:3,4-dihydroxy-2-butanone 4-phosphate synthase